MIIFKMILYFFPGDGGVIHDVYYFVKLIIYSIKIKRLHGSILIIGL